MSAVEQSEEIQEVQCTIESQSESPSDNDGQSDADETNDVQTDAPEQMSKKKRKKLERKARLVEKYKYQKVAAKERKKARKQQDNELLQKLKADGNMEEFQRALDEIRARRPAGARDRVTKSAQREALQQVQGPTVVFDCSFDELMTDRDRTSLGVQIRTSYGLNVRGAAPVAFVVTSLTPKLQTILDPQHDKWIMRFDEHHYLEAFPEKEKVVYLTAESDNVLETLDVDTKYIIGGVVDHNRHKGHCHKLAVDSGVRTARLPIDEYMSRAATGARQVITVNQVFQILLDFNATRSWSAALGKAMPQRKGFVLKNDEVQIGDEHEAVAADESIGQIASTTDTVAVQP